MKNFILSLCLIASGAIYANAQEKGANTSGNAEKVEVPEAVELIQVAGQLVKYGYAQEAPLPLIQAVEIYQNFTSEGSQSDKTTEDNTEAVADAQTEKGEKVNYDITKLLADATDFADGDATYLALIEAARNGATRGATKDYAAHKDTVKANGTDVYNIRFRGGERACVVVSGDGDTDLDLYIYDENDNLITSDTDYSDDCVCVWNPRWTGNFKIKIINRGPVYNRYVMAVN